MADAGGSEQIKNLFDGIEIYQDIRLFSKAARDAGMAHDISPLLELNANFMETVDNRLVISIRNFDKKRSGNILVLNADKTIVYADQSFPAEDMKPFEKMLQKQYGKSTVITFLVLRRTVSRYKATMNSLIDVLASMEKSFDSQKYITLNMRFGRLYDLIEQLQDIMIRLEETQLKEMQTTYISFDYDVLKAECSYLLDRCKNRFSMLHEIAREREVQATRELNQRIEKLNEVVRKLTALTVVIMLPNLVASHYGMNFANMPELQIPWAYPAVIIVEILLMIAAILAFRKFGWI
ncbi:MAG: magnesium transporter CorA family protein [Candidatus Aenigmarchaeota archaeon]|nr:magnesium transporter CorA family protein [Candidatus Aenigmarchaeota archaeon]